MAFIARQPNGLLCRFSTVVDCVTHYNMTEEEYIELRAEKEREEARRDLKKKWFVRPYQEVLDGVRFDNITKKEWEEVKKEMETK